MTRTAFLRRKNIIIGSLVLLVILLVAGFFILRRPTRVAMERYAPADALMFVEIESLADLVDGLTDTKAWRELAPVLGLSSQLRQVGTLTDLVGRSGLGPDEAVVAGRAQFAVVITGIESNTGETEEGPYIHLKPAFALIIETHMKPDTAARLVRERASLIAERIYGESVAEHPVEHLGSTLRVFEGPGSGHQLVVSSLGSVILIGNRADAATKCLDAIAGRATTLDQDQTLKQMRSEVGLDPEVFGYISAAGIEKLVELWPLLFAGRGGEPESIGAFADLIEHLAKQIGAGLFYSARFEQGGVTEKYLAALRPPVAEALSRPLKPVSGAASDVAAILPDDFESVTVLNAENVGELPERVFKQLSPTVDIVAGVALREFIIDFRKQYGLEPKDSVGDALGNQMAVVNLGDDNPRAMLIRVNDKSRVEPLAARYAMRKSSGVKREQLNGSEILVGSDDDRRGAGFIGDYLVLGTRDQIAKLARTKSEGRAVDERVRQALEARPTNASIFSYRNRVDEAGTLLLALSKLTRVTDGSRELLNRELARKALERLPRSISFTEFRESGVYVETHSAVGNFSAIGSLLGTED